MYVRLCVHGAVVVVHLYVYVWLIIQVHVCQQHAIIFNVRICWDSLRKDLENKTVIIMILTLMTLV